MDTLGWVDFVLKGLVLVVAFFMTFLILLQEGKGGGLAALGGTKAAGVEGVTNPIRRATGYLAGIFFSLLIILGLLHRPDQKRFVPEQANATTTTKTAPAVVPPPEAKKIEDKAGEVKPNDVKAGDASKTGETAKPGDVKATEPPKTEGVKPADTAKPAAAAEKAADVKTPAEAARTEAKPPAEAPKAEAKPEEKKPDEKK